MQTGNDGEAGANPARNRHCKQVLSITGKPENQPENRVFIVDGISTTTHKYMYYTNRMVRPMLMSFGVACVLGLGQAYASEASKKTSEVSADALKVQSTSNAGGVQLPMLQLDAVSVLAHRFVEPLSSIGVSVTVLDVEALKEEGIYSLAEAVSTAPGVVVGHDGGQRGGISALRFRGLNSGIYTLNMVDGLRLSDSNISPVNYFGNANIMQTGSLEVLLGPQGALYGGEAIGGVVSSTTPIGSGKPTTKIFSEGGSFGSYLGTLSNQGKVGKLAWFAGSGYETTQNDPRSWKGFANNPKYNDFDQNFHAASLQYDVSDKTTIGGTFRISDSTYERAVPDPAGGWPGTNRVYLTTDHTKSWLMTLNGQSRISDKWTSGFVTGFFKQEYNNMVHDNPAESPYASNALKVQFNWNNQYRWNEKHKTNLVSSYEYSEFESASIDPAFDDNRIVAGVLEHLWSPRKGLDFSAALRAEDQSAWGSKLTWRTSASWQALAKTRLFSSLGTGYRTPTFIDLYGDFGYYKGNPDLRPMETIGWDLGVEQKIGKNSSMTVTGFMMQLSDNIVYDGNATPNTMINAGTADVYGVETSFKHAFKDKWNSNINANYTYAYSRAANNRSLPASVGNVYNINLETSPLEPLTCGIGVQGAGKRQAISSGQTLDNYACVRLYSRYKVNERLSLHARVENLFNEEYVLQEDYYGAWPARGIGFFGGATVTF